TYINIDDTWQGPRGGSFAAIQGNEKFPDMKELCDTVHGLGLKIGIYSTPWVTSYAGYIGGSSDQQDGAWSAEKEPRQVGWRHGKISFAENDAKQWAVWGMDYLKYDWNPNDVPHVTEMAQALRASGRDIVYSLSNSAPFNKAGEWAKLAHCWRTTGDIVDNWGSVSSIGFSQDRWAPFAGPGHWNDADMLVVGHVGWGPSLHPTHLTPDEQYTHISLWCLLASPLLLGCDLTRLDEFTLNLLTNDEVLEVNQDPLGKQARRMVHDEYSEVWAKDMEDGSKAVGLFSRGFLFDEPREVSVTWDLLGIREKRRIRDLWRQKDLGIYEDKFIATVPPHGVVLIRLYPE
ncbi:MAG: glycoside hydrolase family 27 protein, partial [Sedimentisphaerales bacterium]|nr:glycoside hydrolase family 27 protein [Sedimentisphaerales bacterium]